MPRGPALLAGCYCIKVNEHTTFNASGAACTAAYYAVTPGRPTVFFFLSKWLQRRIEGALGPAMHLGGVRVAGRGPATALVLRKGDRCIQFITH